MNSIQIGVLLGIIGLARCLEVGVPERFLRPRTFNPHPYALAEDAATYTQDSGLVQDISSLPHPYRFFERPPTRGEPSNGAPIQFPKVPEAAQVQPQQPRLKPPNIKHPLHINDVNYEEAPLQRVALQRVPVQRVQLQDEALQQVEVPVQHYQPAVLPSPAHQPRPLSYRSKLPVPKNYAFSYAVRDGDSGDDFSHSQAHSGAQTKGEYRVKLPDGRTQVVSYTADDHGYRADVRYDEENSVEPAYYKPQPVLKYKPIYKPAVVKDDYKQLYYEYRPKPDYTPIHEDQSEASPSPRPASPQLFNGGSTPTPSFFIHSTPAPKFTSDYYPVTSTPSPQVYYPSSTVPSRFSPSTSSPEHNYYLIH